MDGISYRAVVFNAARSGNVKRLQVFLEGRDNEWLQECLSCSEGNTPPIVIASKNGHLEVVKYLISIGANVFLKGVVSFDGEIITGAPALWAASAAGHYDVVRYLVEEGGADINQTTDSSSSPLRGACYDGHFKIGNTAMHDAAEAGSWAIVQMLLRAGACNVPDEFGVTPMMCAALAGHITVIRILKAYAKPQDVRDALKLYGATLVDRNMDISGAIHIWTEALEYGFPNDKRERHEVYDGLTEIDSYADIRNVIGDPDAMRMQALIIRERILGRGHHETHYYIRYRGALYCDLGQNARGYQLWMHALNLQQEHLYAFHPLTTATIMCFVDTFVNNVNELIINRNADDRRQPVSRQNILSVFDKAVFEMERFAAGDVRLRTEDTLEEKPNEKKCFEFYVMASIQLMLLFNRISAFSSTSEGEESIKEQEDSELLFKIVFRFVFVCGQLSLYPLHVACNDKDKSLPSHFSCAPVIEMLIKAGIDVNLKDPLGNTALHVVLFNNQPRTSIIQLLLSHGAALLARNKADQTCFQLIFKLMPRSLEQLRLGKYLTLQGFAANSLQRYDLTRIYHGYISHLQNFIYLH